MTFSAGATMHLHYCMGEFVNISLVDTNSGACVKCGMESHGDDNGCCKDVEVTAKISDAHYSAPLVHILQIYVDFIPSYTAPISERIQENEVVNSFITSFSTGEHPLFIQFCNLRI